MVENTDARKIMSIEVNSHHFSVRVIQPRARGICYGFSKQFIEYAFNKSPDGFSKTPQRIYATSNKHHTEFRFLISTFDQFKKYLESNGLNETYYSLSVNPLYAPYKATIPLKPGWVVLAEQEPVAQYLSDPATPKKLVTLQTGKGKTFTSLNELSRRGHRSIIVIKPMYIEQWVKAIRATCDIPDEELVVVQGSKDLKAFIAEVSDPQCKYSIIIVSNKTYFNWIKDYEELGKDIELLGYDCLPQEFFQHSKTGTRLVDEVHMEFHFQVKLDCYTHVPNSISLSATFLSDNPFIEKMQKLAYPINTRFKGLELDKYTQSYAIFYNISNPRNVRTTEYGDTRYSHLAFEKCLLKNPKWLENYCILIDKYVKESYIDCTRNVKRVAIFASSIAMCTHLTQWFKKKYPALNVYRYVEDDAYEGLANADIIVTTVLSAGTAVDIKDLVSVILTININSTQANIQTLGRLRKLADYATRFYYLVCVDITKHIEYHNNKQPMLKARSLTYETRHSGFIV